MVSLELNRRKGDFGFDVIDAEGHIISMDGSTEIGGESYGFRPMQVLLASLAGCSGIDVIQILKKKRKVVREFSVKVYGERENDVVPSLWKKIILSFFICGDISKDDALKAIELSVNKYCSVAETLRRAGASIECSVEVFP